MPIYKRQATKEKERKFFTKLRDAMPLPDLLEVQKNSYDWFSKRVLKNYLMSYHQLQILLVVI